MYFTAFVKVLRNILTLYRGKLKSYSKKVLLQYIITKHTNPLFQRGSQLAFNSSV